MGAGQAEGVPGASEEPMVHGTRPRSEDGQGVSPGKGARNGALEGGG